MSFSSIEKALREAEAVANYDSLKAENEAHKMEINRLNGLLVEERRSHNTQISKLGSQVAAQEALRNKYNKSRYTLEGYHKCLKP